MASRIAVFRARMAKEGIDGFLTFHGPNRNYLSGFSGSSGALILGPQPALFITDSRYTSQAKKQVKDARILQHSRPLLQMAAEEARAAKVRKLGFEAQHVSYAAWETLKKALKGVQLVPVKGLVEAQRAVKDEGEKDKMRAAARITDAAFDYVLGVLKPGVREKDVAAKMEHFMRSQGASGPSFDTIVASGWRSALPHGVASDKKVEKGDMVVIDFGCVYDGYCSDMTRTVCVGRPDSLQKKVYAVVSRAQHAGLDRLKAGQTGRQIDAVSRGIIKKAGYAKHFDHGLGHGVGVEVHESPTVSPAGLDKLVPGNAVTVEPGIYLEGRFGVRIEDLAFVTASGHENLYKSTKKLISI